MTLAIETHHLAYKYPNTASYGIEDININIEWGTTNLIIGLNGAGKSTLLRLLAGKTLIKPGHLKLSGFDPFEFTLDRNEKRNSDINNYVTYLGIEWASNPIVKREIPVNLLISSIGGETYTERRDKLIALLDVDPEWLMSNISDGERRRVQLVMGLLKPWKLLLLDEVTVDLDVMARDNLLTFLKQECRDRNACVVYATHIYDGLSDNWYDRLLHLSNGRIQHDIRATDLTFEHGLNALESFKSHYKVPTSNSIYPLVQYWLQDDLQARGSRQHHRQQMAKRHNDWQNSRDGEYYEASDETIRRYFQSTRS